MGLNIWELFDTNAHIVFRNHNSKKKTLPIVDLEDSKKFDIALHFKYNAFYRYISYIRKTVKILIKLKDGKFDAGQSRTHTLSGQNVKLKNWARFLSLCTYISMNVYQVTIKLWKL